MTLEINSTKSIQPPQSGGGSINNQNITVTTNGVYSAEQGYTGLGTVTVNVLDSFAPMTICATNVRSEVQE